MSTNATWTWTPSAPTTIGQYTATCSGARDSAGNVQTASAGVTINVVSTVANRADVSVTLSCPATARLNVVTTCTLTVRNAGPGTAQGIAAQIVLPKSLSGVAVNVGGTLTSTGALWKLTPLTANTSATLTVTVKPIAKGKVTATAGASSTTPDPNYLNNVATSSLSVT